MKPLIALLAVALLGVCVAACGESKNTTTAAQQKPASTSTTTASGSENSASENTPYPVASTADKQAITTLVKRYYAAASTDNGAAACGLIYSIFAEAIPEDYGQPPGPRYLRGKTCGVVMSKLFKHLPPGQSPASLAHTQVTTVLVRGRKGIAMLHSSAFPKGEILVERERSSWKVSGLIGSACTSCWTG